MKTILAIIASVACVIFVSSLISSCSSEMETPAFKASKISVK